MNSSIHSNCFISFFEEIESSKHCFYVPQLKKSTLRLCTCGHTYGTSFWRTCQFEPNVLRIKRTYLAKIVWCHSTWFVHRYTALNKVCSIFSICTSAVFIATIPFFAVERQGTITQTWTCWKLCKFYSRWLSKTLVECLMYCCW